jgi:hypothetical protein
MFTQPQDDRDGPRFLLSDVSDFGGRTRPPLTKGQVMTPIAGFFLALIAGWIIAGPRRAAATVILPYLAVTAVQTWSLAKGFGVNPPSTVTPVSGAISYYVVQLIFLVTTVVIAAEVAVLRRHALAGKAVPVDPPAGSWYRTAVATAVCMTGTLVLLVAWLSRASLVTHHSSSSNGPPAQGIIGIGLSLIGFVAFGVAALMARRKAARRALADPAQAASSPAGSAHATLAAGRGSTAG